MNIKEQWLYLKIRKIYYALKNWETTKDNLQIAHKIKKYKNLHKGQSCVVVGNGPSLTVADLTKLHQLQIPTFACNRIHLVFEQTEWRPSYYFMSDAKLVKQYTDDVQDVAPKCRFFPKRYRDQIKNGIFYNELEFDYTKEGKFSVDFSQGLYPAGSVTTEMIQAAYYMGFSEIYLIGVDFSYAVNNPLNQSTYTYQGENNYFIKNYLKPGEVADIPNVEANLLGFHAAKEAIEGQGRIIMNATRGGKLEVFDRVDLDELFRRWER